MPKKLAISARLNGRTLSRPIADPLTGEIVAEEGEVIGRDKAHQLENLGVDTAWVRLEDGSEIKIFSNSMVDIGNFVGFDCKELGVKYVLTKAKSDLHAKVLQRVGADKVVFPERDMGARTAYNLVSTNILDYIELSPDYSLVEISVPPQWVGKNMRELNLRVRYGINVMAIRHVGGDISVAPQGIDALEKDDVLVAIGSNASISKLEDMAGR